MSALRPVLVTWVIAAAALLLLGAILPGVDVTDVRGAFAAAAVAGLLNALVWPLVIRLALPLTVLTLGLGALVLNGVVVVLVAAITPGLKVHGIGSGIVLAIGLTAITTIVESILAIDDDARIGRHLARRAGLRRGQHQLQTDVPGLLFLEVDGLAHEVLARALRDGNVPTLAGWLRDGTHRLERWETDWSSQTGACQAGLLHGSNEDMPAFRWWEKDRGRPIVTNHPRDAAEIERRVSDHRGLLHADGASRANILSGDAPHSLLTMSTVLGVRRAGARVGEDYFTYFASPYNATRTFLLALADMWVERWAAMRQRRGDVRPRIDRDRRYALVRAWATVVQRDLQVEAVLGDVAAGRPVIYTTFLAYDEVAHHSGIERPDTLAVLRQVDRAIGRIARAARNAPRPYELVVLSDHGQTQGATFLQRTGTTLEDLVSDACSAGEVEGSDSGEDEALGRLGAALTEASQAQRAAGRALARLTRRRRVDGEVRLGEDGDGDGGGADAIPEVSVMASGCLGLVTFPRLPGRVPLEELDARYPRLLPALRDHPAIGFVLVRSARRGAVVLGARGARWLDAGEVEGEDPLAAFGPHAARHVARTDRFPHCPDVVVNSAYWPQTSEVAAFEELVGSHGGLGGGQSHPFVLAPARFVPAGDVVGAEAMHRVLRGWLAAAGHDAYARGGEPGSAARPGGGPGRAARPGERGPAASPPGERGPAARPPDPPAGAPRAT